MRLRKIQRWRRGALDHEPQHERNSPEEGGEGEVRDSILVLGQQEAREAKDQIREAVEEQPNAQKARQEARPVGEDPQGEKPKTPKDLGSNDFLVMQSEE